MLLRHELSVKGCLSCVVLSFDDNEIILNIINKNMTKTLLVVISMLVIGCQSPSAQGEFTTIITANEVVTLLSEDLQIIDVRTPREFTSGHIPNAQSINVNDSDFLERMKLLDREKPLLIYCAVGGRSTKATDLIVDLGFKQIYNYKGGMQDWSQMGMQVEK